MGVEHAIRAGITLNGLELGVDLTPYVEQVVVDDNLHLPDTFTITFFDPALDMLTRAGLRMATKVEISGTPRGSEAEKPLIIGEVTALEADCDPLGNHVTVRGYDFSHRLQRGRRTELYTDSSDDEIARKIAQRAQIEIGEIEPTAQVHKFLSQANQTDWEFLLERAQTIGYEAAVIDGKFYFRSLARSATAPAEGNLNSATAKQLVPGKGLIEFHVRISGAEQFSEIEVRGWNPDVKQAVVATAKAGTVVAELDSAKPADLAQTFGNQKFALVDRVVRNDAEAVTLAKSTAERIGSGFAEADGVAEGNPELRAGVAVSIAGLGGFPGRYVLSHTRHVFNNVGYRTHFSVTGRQERSLLGLVSHARSAGSGSSGAVRSTRMFGLVRAIVTANDDPEKEGRVRLGLPWMDADYQSPWASVAHLGAGPSSGALFVPEVGDEVLVGFEHGDFRFPVVVGGLYNGIDKPFVSDGLVNNGNVTRRSIVSRTGHRLYFADPTRPPEVDPTRYASFDDADESGIALVTGDGSIQVVLRQVGRQLLLKCAGDVLIDAGGNLKLSSQGAMTLESQGALQLKGLGGVKIESPAVVEAKGSLIKLN